MWSNAKKLYLSALPRVFEMAADFNQILHVIISSVHFSFQRLKTVLYAWSKNYFLNVKSGRLLPKVIDTYKQDPQCKKIMPCSKRTLTMRVCNLNEGYPQHIICVHSGIGQQYHWRIEWVKYLRAQVLLVGEGGRYTQRVGVPDTYPLTLVLTSSGGHQSRRHTFYWYAFSLLFFFIFMQLSG